MTTEDSEISRWILEQLNASYRPLTAAELAASSSRWTTHRIRDGLRALRAADVVEPVPRPRAKGVAWQTMSAGPDELPA
jgi:hypothetical protein